MSRDDAVQGVLVTEPDQTGRDDGTPPPPPGQQQDGTSQTADWGGQGTGGQGVPAGYGAQPGYPPSPGAAQHGNPRYGGAQYGSPQYGAPQYGAPQYGSSGWGGTPGYTPPPQYGVVPLRPLSLGELFDGSFKSVRANPKVMFGFSAVVVLAATALGILVQYALLPTLARTASGWFDEIDPSGELLLAESTASSLSLLGALPFSYLAVTVLTGLLTASVSQSVIGRTITTGELWNRYWKRVALLLVFSVLLQVGLALPWVGLTGVVYLMAVNDLAGWAVLVALALALLIFVGSVWVYVRVLLVPPALVLEGVGLRTTVVRAWRLSRGSFWRLLGIYLLASIIIGLVAQVVVVPVTMATTILAMDPLSFTYVAVTNMASALATWLSTVFLAALVALLYIDVRIRREGLDVTLARAAEQAAGETSAR